MDINEYKVKLTGTANIPNSLTNGKMYDLTIGNAEVRKVERVPNDDGTENEIASLRISELSEINIISDKGIIPAKKKGSQARVLRLKIENKADELGLDREDFYQKEMIKIINNYEYED